MASRAEELALWPRRVPGSRTETGGRFEERGDGETMGDSEDSGREKPSGFRGARGESTNCRGEPARDRKPARTLYRESRAFIQAVLVVDLAICPLCPGPGSNMPHTGTSYEPEDRPHPEGGGAEKDSMRR